MSEISEVLARLQPLNAPMPPADLLATVLGVTGNKRFVMFEWIDGQWWTAPELNFRDDGTQSDQVCRWPGAMLFVEHPAIVPYLQEFTFAKRLIWDRKANVMYLADGEHAWAIENAQEDLVLDLPEYARQLAEQRRAEWLLLKWLDDQNRPEQA